MSLTKITPLDIEEYYSENYTDSKSIKEISTELLYEGFCEKVVEKNPSYEISQLAAEWRESDLPRKMFAEKKFEKIVSKELEEHLTISHRKKWVNAVSQGIEEY